MSLFRDVCKGILLALAICALVIPFYWFAAGQETRRDQEVLAEGRRAGAAGLPPEACPYAGWNYEARRALWLQGWADARIEALDKRASPGAE
jgi:ribosome modulation factor